VYSIQLSIHNYFFRTLTK